MDIRNGKKIMWFKLINNPITKMAFNKELLKNKQDKRSYYFVKEAMLAN